MKKHMLIDDFELLLRVGLGQGFVIVELNNETVLNVKP